jgi:hypothetical protein
MFNLDDSLVEAMKTSSVCSEGHEPFDICNTHIVKVARISGAFSV